MTDTPEPELPWGEVQWERLMRESDAKSAKFGELLETLMDHPDRDEIIAREMGWDREDEDDDRPEWQREEEDAALIEAMNEPPTEEEMEDFLNERDEVDEIPAYRQSYDWSMRVHHALRGQECDDEIADELLGEAVGQGHCIAAKIAGGHGMGYEDDAICGNIVNCKRALEAADDSLRALRELSDRRPELANTITPLLDEGQKIRQVVVDRIEELRSRVWWE